MTHRLQKQTGDCRNRRCHCRTEAVCLEGRLRPEAVGQFGVDQARIRAVVCSRTHATAPGSRLSMKRFSICGRRRCCGFANVDLASIGVTHSRCGDDKFGRAGANGFGMRTALVSAAPSASTSRAQVERDRVEVLQIRGYRRRHFSREPFRPCFHAVDITGQRQNKRRRAGIKRLAYPCCHLLVIANVPVGACALHGKHCQRIAGLTQTTETVDHVGHRHAGPAILALLPKVSAQQRATGGVVTRRLQISGERLAQVDGHFQADRNAGALFEGSTHDAQKRGRRLLGAVTFAKHHDPVTAQIIGCTRNLRAIHASGNVRCPRGQGQYSNERSEYGDGDAAFLHIERP